jgi:hypothetical protein
MPRFIIFGPSVWEYALVREKRDNVDAKKVGSNILRGD